jgi:DNA-binding Xre family transcriptional regulator
MKFKRLVQRSERTPEETTRLRSDRERYQREKPSIEQLLAEGGHAETVLLGDFLNLKELMLEVRQERERQHLTLAELEERTGIDQAALASLETGRQVCPTFETLTRILSALGKELVFSLRDMTPHASS